MILCILSLFVFHPLAFNCNLFPVLMVLQYRVYLKTGGKVMSNITRSSDKSLKCLCLGNEAYSIAKEMAIDSSLSTSAYLRLLLKKAYLKWSRNKKKELVEVQ